MTRIAVLAAALLALPAPGSAQASELSLEASVFRGTLGYARQIRPGTLLGVEAGFGFPQIDRTLEPRKDPETGAPDLEEYLHGALFLRVGPGDRFEVDGGLRVSWVDLWPCGASDCWPSPFGGGYVQPMVGWRQVKFGLRLTAGWVGETRAGTPRGKTFVVGLAPFLMRATLSW